MRAALLPFALFIGCAAPAVVKAPPPRCTDAVLVAALEDPERGYASDLYVYDDAGGRVLYRGPVLDGASTHGLAVAGEVVYASHAAGRRVERFDLSRGQPLGPFGDVPDGAPLGLTFGPDGHLYVLAQSDEGPRVVVLDGATGQRLRAFGEALPPWARVGAGIAFGPDGHLYVAHDGDGGSVVRFDARGAILDVYVKDSGAFDLAFDAAGRLYVSDFTGHRVVRYDADRSPEIFAAGLAHPYLVDVAPDGAVYVMDASMKRIDRYDPGSKVRLGTFIGPEETRFQGGPARLVKATAWALRCPRGAPPARLALRPGPTSAAAPAPSGG